MPIRPRSPGLGAPAGRLPVPESARGPRRPGRRTLVPMAGTTPKTRRRRTIGGAGLTRMLSLLAFLPVASRVPDYARLVTALVLDERMPKDRKVLLGAAAGYLVLGRDLIPDDVPI